MASVRDHLRLCPDCRVNHAAWQALAAATGEIAAAEPWLSRGHVAATSVIPGGIASSDTEHAMDATTRFPARFGAGSSAGKFGRGFGLSRLKWALEVVAVVAIAAVLIAGFFAYRDGSPPDRGTSVPGAAQNATPESASVPGCRVTPRTPQDLARILGESGARDTTFTEFAVLPELPEGGAVELATHQAIEATWNM
jgi:hypothetical protein